MSATIFIYFYSQLNQTRDAIEDALDECLEGRGEVTGGGVGNLGSNIDIEVFEGAAGDYLWPIRRTLRRLRVPSDTRIVIEDGEFSVYDDEAR